MYYLHKTAFITMGFNRKKTGIALAYLLLAFFTQAQTGCPEVNAGNNVNLPCGTNCTTLTASAFQVGSTSTYTVSQIAYSPPVAFNAGTVLPVTGDDYWSAAINLPFTFCFFGASYTSVIVSSNGAISFNTANASANPASYQINNPAPVTGEDNDMQATIMCPYQDLDNTNHGTIRYYIGGAAPCRYFVAIWDNLAMYGDAQSTATGYCNEDDHQYQMAVIYETTNVIEMYIQNKDAICDDGFDGQFLGPWNGGLAIEGIQDFGITTFVGVPGRNGTQWSATNDAWRFTPAGPSIVNVSWYNGATQISADSVVQVCPGNATTTYTAQAVYTPCAGGTPVTVTDNVTVTLAGSLIATVDSFKNVSCAGLNNGAIYAHVTTANPPLTFGWSNGATTQTLTNLAPGTYILTASDASGCIRKDTVVITEPAVLTAGIPNSAQTNCTGTGTGTLTAVPLGGNSPYTYAWNNGEAAAADTNITAGTYSVIVTDSTGCTVTASGTLTITAGTNTITLNQPVITNVSCFGNLDGSIVASVTGGVSPIQYAWSNLQNGPAINNLPPGPYTVSVTDAGGCSVSATYNITQPQPLTVNPAYIVNDQCGSLTDGEIIAQVSGGTTAYSYAWTEVANSQNFTGDTIMSLPPGNYTLTVTDANGCTGNGSYQITQTPALLVSYDSTNVTCFGGNNGTGAAHVTTGTPPYLFSWDQNPSTTSDSTISNLSAGPVDIYITDANNCIVDRVINITQPTQVSTQLVTSTNVTCNGLTNGTVTVSATGGTAGIYTFAWNNGVTGAKDTALAPGVLYTVVATDVNGCTGSGQYSVTQPTALQINAPTIQNIGCGGGNTGAITANVTQGTPGYTYSWQQLPAGQSYTGQTITGLAAGSYFLSVQDANGCPDTTSYTITAIPLLTFTTTPTPVSCYGGNNGGASVTVTSGTPPYQYSFNNGAYSTNSSINNLTAGTLFINVTDSNTCLDTAIITITQPAQALLITLVSPPTEVQCNSGSNGELNIVATGGTQPYTFTWNNQFTGTDNTNLSAGPYTVILVDFNDCADTANYVITQPDPLVANPTHINALCYLGADGSIDINPSGGVPAYSFNWSNNQTTQVADTLRQGLYTCTITDANGCSIVATDTVGQPTQIQYQDSGIAVLCVGQRNGKIVVDATGGTPPYFYNATQDFVNFVSTNNSIIEGLDTGHYNIQISDSLGCIVIDPHGYVPPAIPDEFYAPIVDSTLCYGPGYNDGAALVLDSTIQNGPYQYSIDGGILQDSGYFQNLSSGPHTIAAVSNNGCVSTIPVVVPEPLPVIAIVTPDSVTLPLGGSQSVLATYLNASNVTYNWTPAMGLSCVDCPNPVVNAYAAVTYTVTISMGNQNATCYGSTTLVVDVLGHTKSFIPNAFSPNGDGNNDLFQVYGEDIKTLDMKVFNRWGEKVYSTTNSLSGWDGTYKGTLQMTGVYTYEVSITYLDDTKEFKTGSITMIR